jgi:hypothetical protein
MLTVDGLESCSIWRIAVKADELSGKCLNLVVGPGHVVGRAKLGTLLFIRSRGAKAIGLFHGVFLIGVNIRIKVEIKKRNLKKRNRFQAIPSGSV